MRRVVAVLMGVAILVVAGGVAEAAITHRQDGPFGMLVAASTDQQPEQGMAGAPEAKSKAPGKTQAKESKIRPAPALIGGIEPVNQVLDLLGNGRTELHYKDAEYVKPHISKLVLLPGQYLKVSDKAGKESRYYGPEGLPLNPASLLDVGKTLSNGPLTGVDKWVMSVPGDTAVLEVVSKRLPLPTEKLGGLGVTVDKVARGFGKKELAAKEKPRTESVCKRDDKSDAVCFQSEYPREFEHAKPVARLLINGVELCTAWRIGANNRMLTNQHCIASQRDVNNTEVWFNYQCAVCGAAKSEPVTKVWGDQFLATDDKLDFTLFSVGEFEEIQSFGYLEFDDRRPDAGEEIYIPQHPGGQTKQIAMTSDADGANCKVDDPNFEGYGPGTDVSYFCDTEGGSSGSPVLSRRTHKVVALHHFGGCPNSGVRVDLIQKKIAGKL
ncbi:serine protease [Longispora sp. NPDC051575]|uniref:trypsin-like serine peptidase n=1 Tax=Longispora sp. NPDC051575 TaxID=3154943 RepID=UPI0034134A11